MSKNAMENKTSQTLEEFKKHLQEQIQFLEDSALSYDNGYTSEAKRLAVVLRVLLHDTAKSKSLLSLLGLKDRKFYDSSLRRSPNSIDTHEGLVVIHLGPGDAKYIPPLDDLPWEWKRAGFDEYWNNPVFIDKNKNSFSRKDLVCAVTNKDGGAHVDPNLNDKYTALTRHNSLGWMYESGNNKSPIKGVELAAIRQIAHEVLKTLKSEYPEKKLLHKEKGVIFGGISIETKSNNQIVDTKDNFLKQQKMGRNDPCPCGKINPQTGKPMKYKKCCWPKYG